MIAVQHAPAPLPPARHLPAEAPVSAGFSSSALWTEPDALPGVDWPETGEAQPAPVDTSDV